MNKEKLEQFPYFTNKMLKAFLKINYPEVYISRWKKQLITIEKGKYTVHENPLIYATTIITPSYASFRTALNYYQLTNQIPLKTQIIANKYKKNTNLIDFTYSKYMFGYEKIKIDEFDLFIANKEKLIIDCILYPNKGVYASELTELLKEQLDLKKIVKYLKKIRNITLTKRVGYLLETQNKKIYGFFKKDIIKDNNYPKLNPLLNKTNKINSKWKLNINEDINND